MNSDKIQLGKLVSRIGLIRFYCLNFHCNSKIVLVQGVSAEPDVIKK